MNCEHAPSTGPAPDSNSPADDGSRRFRERRRHGRDWKVVFRAVAVTASLLFCWPSSMHGQSQGPRLTPSRGSGAGPRTGTDQRMPSNRGGDSRAGVPEWTVEPAFRNDVFTFVRIQYSSGSGGGRWRSRWQTDYPASDLNFSFRLEQLTSMKVDPNGLTMELSDPRLFDFPFIFIIDPRNLFFSEYEAEILRRYLLGGGFLMVDDFWGQPMWRHFTGELKKVFPERDPVELPHDHTIFNCVFHLDGPPQVPSEDSAHRGRESGSTWEDEIREPHAPADYQGIFDDQGRMMVLLCHNTDLSDGWEEEGVSEWFFTNFSEKFSYPMGINIVFYAMTH